MRLPEKVGEIATHRIGRPQKTDSIVQFIRIILTCAADSAASLASTEGQRFRFGLEVVSVEASESLML